MAHFQTMMETPIRWPMRLAAVIRRQIESRREARRMALARKLNG